MSSLLKTATGYLSKYPWLESFLTASVVWLITIPTWAISPQSGDAAEQITTAIQGGVLHPPGFPLQAVLNRLFLLLPFGTPAYRIAFLDSLGFACMAFALLEILRRLQCDRASRIAGMAAAVFFPILWFLGVHPEVFSLANAAVALLLLQAITLSLRENGETNVTDAFLLGVGVGLAWSQHTITIVTLPACLCSAYHLLRDPETRLKHFAIASVSLLVPFCSLYMSLILMGRNAVWPNWGPPRDFVGVLRHMLRSDYGSFTLALQLKGDQTPPTFAITVLFAELWENWQIFVGLAVMGIVFLFGKFRKYPRTVLFAILGNLGLALIFLCLAAAPFGPRDSRAHLERFLGLAVIPLAVLLGIGADSIRLLTSGRLPESIRKLVLAVFVGALILNGWVIADGSNRRISDLYRQALALDLPPDAVWVAFSDLECDYGVLTENGVRFPVQAGDIGSEWYRTRVAPAIEPRLVGIGHFETMPELIKLAHERGIPIASSDPFLMAHVNQTPELHGLLFHDTKSRRMFTRETYLSAVRLCPLIAELPPLQLNPSPFDLFEFDPFSRAFDGAGRYLEVAGDVARSRIALDISYSLKYGRHPETWRKLCERLK